MSSSPGHWPRLSVMEAVSTLVLLAHAVVFAIPPNTFALSINYRLMQSIAPEWLWGASFGMIFSLWAAAFMRRVLRLRQVMLSIVGVCILWMGISFFLSNVNTAIGYTLVIVGVGALAGRVGLR